MEPNLNARTTPTTRWSGGRIDFTPNPLRRHTRGRRGKVVNEAAREDQYSKKLEGHAMDRAKVELAFEKKRRQRAWKGKEFRSEPKYLGGAHLSGDSRSDRIRGEANARRVRTSPARNRTRSENRMRAALFGEDKPVRNQKVVEQPIFDISRVLSQFKRGKIPDPSLRPLIESSVAPAGRGREKERLLRAMGNVAAEPTVEALVLDMKNTGLVPELSARAIKNLPAAGVMKRHQAKLIAAKLLKSGIEPNPGPGYKKGKLTVSRCPREPESCPYIGKYCPCYRFSTDLYKCSKCGTAVWYVRRRKGHLVGTHCHYLAGVPNYNSPSGNPQSYVFYEPVGSAVTNGIPPRVESPRLSNDTSSSSGASADCSSSSVVTDLGDLEAYVITPRSRAPSVPSITPHPFAVEAQSTPRAVPAPPTEPAPPIPVLPPPPPPPVLEILPIPIAPVEVVMPIPEPEPAQVVAPEEPTAPARSWLDRLSGVAQFVSQVAVCATRYAMSALSSSVGLSPPRRPTITAETVALEGHIYDVNEGHGDLLDFDSPLFELAGYKVLNSTIDSCPRDSGHAEEVDEEGVRDFQDDRIAVNRNVKVIPERYQVVDINGMGRKYATKDVFRELCVGTCTLASLAAATAVKSLRTSVPYPWLVVPCAVAFSSWCMAKGGLRVYNTFRKRRVTISYVPHLVSCALSECPPAVTTARYADTELTLQGVTSKVARVASIALLAREHAKLAHGTALVTTRVLQSQNFY